MNLGFVGLGNMGGPMVVNLLKAGHRLAVCDLSIPAVARAEAAGAIPMDSPEAVARFGEAVLTSLPTPAAVEAVYLGPRGLFEGARDGQLFVDLSSVTPSLSRMLADRFREKGAIVLDAPVSGGTTGARDGTLAVMIGGEAEAVAQAKRVLGAIADKFFHVGPVGAGSTIKILNQLMMGINSVAAIEMLALAQRSGIDLALVREVVGASSGFSRSFQSRFPRVVERDFAPGFAIDLMCKDLRLGQEMARELDAPLPVASLVLSLFQQATERGLGQQDVSAALQLFEG
ncbi:MAG: NAD(P)-dependent oxidoreductase [Chloroflexota bacterium]